MASHGKARLPTSGPGLKSNRVTRKVYSELLAPFFVDLLNFCIMNRCDIYIYPYIPIYTIIYPYIPIYNPINYICTQTLKNPEHFYAVPFQTKVAGSKSHGDESSNAPRCQELCQPKVEER